MTDLKEPIPLETRKIGFLYINKYKDHMNPIVMFNVNASMGHDIGVKKIL